jgi:beta-glucosidase
MKFVQPLLVTGVTIALSFFQLQVSAQTGKTMLPQLGKSSIKEVIAAMTLEEKAAMVIGGGRKALRSAPDGSMTMIGYTEFRVPGGAGITNAIPRLGIPSMVTADGPAGVRISPYRNKDSSRSYFATAFPVGTALASTWDLEMVNKVGQAFGNEVREYGIDILLAPGVNIHRNPLGGRNFEYYSEDPLVTGKMAAAIINGMQSNGIGTSIKHFAANNQETNRDVMNTMVSERTLREIYLKGFEIAIKEAQPWTVMSSYNKLNNLYTSENEALLSVLRNDWQFKGYVMSDWGGRATDWIAQMKAGNDVIMPGRAEQINRIVAAVRHDSLDEKILDRNIEHLLGVVLQSPAFRQYKYSDRPDLKAHAQVARQAAAEGMVLLKNRNAALPLLKTAKTIAAFGNTTYSIIAGGYGSGEVNKAYVVSLEKGLANAGYHIDKELAAIYTQFLPKTDINATGGILPAEMEVADALIEQKSKECSIGLITIGRTSGETVDRKLDSNYRLLPVEQQLIKRVAAAFHNKGKKLVIVLNIGGVIEMTGWQNEADAILLAWQPGLEGGNAIADVLTGKINPSGKLATTFPAAYKDVPSALNFPGTPADKPSLVTYEEGIYTGYRYYDTFDKQPAYEFGYGLSYTSFELGGLTLSATRLKDSITAKVKVTNTGKVAGKEVVQLYISAPAVTIDKPAQELKAFAKTTLLAPGASQIISFTVRAADLASFYSDRSAWVAEAGTYLLKAGVSSRNIKQTATVHVAAEIVTEKVRNAPGLGQPVKEIKPVKR